MTGSSGSRGSSKPPTGDVNETRLDAALRDWPDVGPTAREQEDFAARVMARVASGDRGESRSYIEDSKLLASPLPQLFEESHNLAAFGGTRKSAPSAHVSSVRKGAEKEAGRAPVPSGNGERDSRSSNPPGSAEGIKMSSQSSERERDRRSLKDLARLASSTNLAPTPHASSGSGSVSGVRATDSDKSLTTKEDSGLIDLKAMSQSSPDAVERSASQAPLVPPPLASSGLFDDDAVPSPKAASPSIAPSRPSVPSTLPAAVQAAPSVPVPAVSNKGAQTERKASGALYFFGGVVTLAAVAAGAFFVMKTQQPKAPVVVVAPAQEQVAPAQAAATQAAATAPIAAAGNTVDPSSLPQTAPAPQANLGASQGEAKSVAAAAAQQAHGAKPAIAAKGATKGEKGAAEAKPDESKAIDPKLVAKDLPTSPATTGALGDAMKQAAGPVGGSDQAAPAATNPNSVIQPGTVSQIPATGALKGAIGATVPSARACLGPDDPISRAQLVFESSGTVKSVTVTGSAAGKPAEACIKAALSKTKVAPFAQATYAVTVPIRPN